MVEKKVVVKELPVVDPVVVDIIEDAPLFEEPLKEGVTKADSKSKGIKLGARHGFGNDLGSQLNLVTDIVKDLLQEGRLNIESKDGKQTVYLVK